ncbi:MAG: TerD family protein [Desulfobacterales bacterium]|nr:TerD family protein [Desulfobacterales bacterium]
MFSGDVQEDSPSSNVRFNKTIRNKGNNMFDIIEKGQKLDLSVVSKQGGSGKFYFGAGWDNPSGPVDLDIVAVMLDSSGKITKKADLIYFGNKTQAGVTLSADNTTGEGDGDDESIVIDTSLIPSDVDSIVVGLAAYSGNEDLATAPNAHFRVCDGEAEGADQIGAVHLSDAAASDTVVAAFTLTRSSEGLWELQNTEQFHQLGNGSRAIESFGEHYA